MNNISREAIDDENLGLVFATKIKLNKRHLMVNGMQKSIGPGPRGLGRD